MSYSVNGTNLDDIFKSRITEKRTDVNFLSGGVDISNKYEKTINPKDQISFDTRFVGNVSGVYTDLRYLFQSKNYYELTGTIYTTSESYAKYVDLNNGTITVNINTLYLKAVNGLYNITFSIPGRTYTRSLPAPYSSNNGIFTDTITGLGGGGDYIVTITDNNSLITKTVRVYVGYNDPSRGPWYF